METNKESWKEEFDKTFFIPGKNAYGIEIPMLIPAKCEIRDFIEKQITLAVEAERERIKNILESKTRTDLPFPNSGFLGTGGNLQEFGEVIGYNNAIRNMLKLLE